MNKIFGQQIISFVLYILLQVLFFNYFVLFNTAFCYVYVGFLLLLPIEIGSVWLVGLGFITGFTLDIFTDTLGVHSAACVLLTFVRPFWMGLITPRGGYENISLVSLPNMGFQWFFMYCVPLLFIHHFVLFFLEAGTFQYGWMNFLRVILSTLLTFIVIVLGQNLFYRKSRTI